MVLPLLVGRASRTVHGHVRLLVGEQIYMAEYSRFISNAFTSASCDRAEARVTYTGASCQLRASVIPPYMRT